MTTAYPTWISSQFWQTLWGRLTRYFLLSFSLSLLIFWSGLDNYFASDDWPAILRNTTLSWQTGPGWFLGLRAGWYRPIHDLFMALCWWLFSLDPLGYRLARIFLYALVAANFGLLIGLLSQHKGLSIVSVVLFTGFATHAEPVIWFAGTNELSAGLFVLISIINYILFRERKRVRSLVLCLICCLLAFACKETTLSFPVMFFVYDYLFKMDKLLQKRPWQFYLPWLLIGLVWVGFLWFRLPMGASYTTQVQVSLWGLLKNFAYYLLITVFLIPNNYAFLDSVSTWRADPLLPIVAIGLSSSIMVILSLVWFRGWRQIDAVYKKAALFCLIWAFISLGPVIFIVTERASFLASMGVVAVIAIGLLGMWKVDRRLWLRVGALCFIYFGLNLYILTYRAGWFEHSAELNLAVMTQLAGQTQHLTESSSIILVNLPDHIQYTFTFRNTFPSATRLLQYPYEVTPVYDSQLKELSEDQQQDYVEQMAVQKEANMVFWYRDGTLILDE